MRIGIATGVPGEAEAIRLLLERGAKHEVAWLAGQAEEARQRCAQDRPDLLLMDLFLPPTGALESTRGLMAATPCAVLLMVSDVGVFATEIFEAMGQGALDAVDTPRPGAKDAQQRNARFLNKLEAIERRLAGGGSPAAPGRAAATLPRPAADTLVAIGASAGGPAALRTVLSQLPSDFSAAVVVVQHMDQRFASGMVDWLAEHSRLPIRLGQEGEVPTTGVVLLAGTNDHLVFKSPTRLGYTMEPGDAVYRPSVDVFFQSICKMWAGRAIGVLLTGMGRDGATGLKALRDKGHHTIAQDQASSAVYGMPKAAVENGAAAEVASTHGMAALLVKTLSKSS